MAHLVAGLTTALNAMTHEADHLLVHTGNLANASWNWEITPDRVGFNENNRGVTESGVLARKSMGRRKERQDSSLQEAWGVANKVHYGTELAVEMVHIVNVQHNFDANAKSVSTIDTMLDTILNMRV